jgi:hypothetical protein
VSRNRRDRHLCHFVLPPEECLNPL